MAKSIPVTKQMVWVSYESVVRKGGGAGIDRQSIEMFNADRNKLLYKLWNRLSSGSYFPPPVRTVLIPKKQGGLRPLGIPTVADRIAQGVVKNYLEPMLEPVFHPSSFGYRPGKSAHDAIKQCFHNCKDFAWVIDVDIKGFFDNINHEKLMKLLELHTTEKWVLMYVERWLKAGVEQEDGSIVAREKGTPQGGVISPLLANVYLHHAFDKWMAKQYPGNPFERYADDIVIHCSSKAEAEEMLARLHERMDRVDLTLHPEKTKIVFCKNSRRSGNHEHESFTFLSFSFQPRIRHIGYKGSRNGRYLVFAPAMCTAAKTSIKAAIRQVMPRLRSVATLDWFAERLNPKIRGWVNYYGLYYRSDCLRVFYYLNEHIIRWMSNKYKIFNVKKLILKLSQLQKERPGLFYHWKLGVTGGFR